MRNIEKWLDMYMYKSYARLRSDYALARHWQVEPSRISQYRRGRLRLPLAQCLEIASVCGREPLEILICREYPYCRELDRATLLNAYFAAAESGTMAEMLANGGSGWRPNGRNWRKSQTD